MKSRKVHVKNEIEIKIFEIFITMQCKFNFNYQFKNLNISVILDCTTDATETEQMAVIIRFASCDNGIVRSTEFLGLL